jgi:hypothetical protein
MSYENTQIIAITFRNSKGKILGNDFNINIQVIIFNYYHPIKVVMNYYDVGIIQ